MESDIKNAFYNKMNRVPQAYSKAQNRLHKGTGISIRTPRMDMYSSEVMYLIRLSIPGVRKEDIKVLFNDKNQIELKGRVNLQGQDTLKEAILKEIYEGPFMRQIDIPEDADKDNIKFAYQAGILELTIPKKK
ncbi:MAG: Hsp20/alpha crystallin family protein [Bacillota bacterium]